MQQKIISDIEAALKQKIIRKQSMGGGCIADNYILYTDKKEIYFLKTGGVKGMFLPEANGLKEIKKANVIRVPEVIYADTDFLLIEYIQAGTKNKDFFSLLGKQLAGMHRYSYSTFGLFENNFIGSNPQVNLTNEITAKNWAEFYYWNRLFYQFNLARQKQYITNSFLKEWDVFTDIILKLLEKVKEPPALLHGDLWSGNFLCDTNQQPVLIDPAVYYGHREADLAMTRLFGGFPPSFYESYEADYPLSRDWQERLNVYKLYHILNHLNLFGTGYLGEAQSLVRYYL